MKLTKHLVEKPWGRTDIPSVFGDMGGRRIGEIWYESDGAEQLPVLVKWLFTSEKLSIQVHPNDEEAQARGLPSGKEECWYIVDAEPGAVLGMGTTRPLDSHELREAALSGEIEQLMDWKPVKAGDYFYIPAGTVHAIGAGITLVEVQQYADITYRLYDYGRPRELHLDDGVAVSHAIPYADARNGNVSGNMQLVDGPHFRLWHVADNTALAALPDAGRYWVVPLWGEVLSSGHETGMGDCLVIDNRADVLLSSGARCLIAA
ncbi:MAG: class I mannose-6-phosphate isomerase [Sphingomonadaceae bacterium]|nr:class I mannose-6-phosphate isomerase [Sphingomonadaceae bacterium]